MPDGDLVGCYSVTVFGHSRRPLFRANLRSVTQNTCGNARDRAERVIGQARARASEVDRPIETAVETGDPAEAILEYVDTHDVDHVVIGGHGGDRSTLDRRWLGTVRTSVVVTAPVTAPVGG